MLKDQTALIEEELREGTGAAIALDVVSNGARSGLEIWFEDLKKRAGPVIELRPHGLRTHAVTLRFGNFSRQILQLISEAPLEDVRLARALLASVSEHSSLSIPGQNLDSWLIRDGKFTIHASLRHSSDLSQDEAIVSTCRELIVPIMASMAELIGYDEVDDDVADGEMEGAISFALIKRRERNRRNRLLSLRIHGFVCKCCGLDPKRRYGEAGGILEVHHIQPLSNLSVPREYDPALDLVPLCPNCHRAIHTRKPIPFSVEELREFLQHDE